MEFNCYSITWEGSPQGSRLLHREAEAQAEAYAQVESDPAVQYMMDKAKEGILSGGSATGNLMHPYQFLIHLVVAV